MWRKKIMQKKTQYTLIGIMIFVTIAIFSLCFCFTSEFSMFSQSVLTDENSSDVYMMGIGTNELVDNLTNDTVKENIDTYNTYEGSTVSVPIMFKEKDITMMYQSMLSIDSIDKVPEFVACEVEGDKKAPGKGEIWVSKSMATPCDIRIGDKITLKYDEPVELKVTGIYTASFLITSNFCFAPLIVSDEDIESFTSEKQSAIFGINLKEDDEEHITELRDAFPYCAFTASRTQLLENFMSVASSVGSFGTIAALIVFLVALVIIRYIVKATILSEFKSIGVYKSLGYRSKEICGFYIKGYMAIGLVAALVGAFLPLPLVEKLGVDCSQYAEGFELTEVSYSVSIMSIVLFMGLLYYSLRKALKDVRKKSAVEIINIGQTMSYKKKVSRSVIKSASSPLQMAVNDIWKHKMVAVLIFLVFILSIYLSLLFAMIGYSSYKMNDNANLWFAVPQNNTYVMGNISDEVIEWIEKNDKVDSFVYGNLLYSIKIESDDTENSLSSVTFDIYNDTSTEKTGVKINGNAPNGKNEIAVTSSTLSIIEREVGEFVRLKINDKEAEYKITGTYNSLLSNVGIMMTTETMKECNEDYVPYTAFVTLKRITDFDSFKEQIEDKFSGVTADKEWFAIDNSMTATRDMLLSISVILVVVLIVFAVLNVAVVLLMENSNRHRQYGIMKALGFTSGYIMKQNICKNMIYTLVGIVFALCIHLSVSKEFLAQKIIDAFSDSGVLMIGIMVLFTGFVALLTYLLSLGIRKIMPIELMEE